MKKVVFTLILYAASALVYSEKTSGRTVLDNENQSLNSSNPLDFVNLFIGTTNGGNVFPGMYVKSSIPVSLRRNYNILLGAT